MYVYWWHVRGLRAVKVGHAEEPRQRVSDYRHEYGLGGKDVRVCKLDGDTDAEWVESQLCRLLEARGFHRIAVRLEEGEEELFALGGRTFEDVHGLLHEAARHIALAEVSNRRKQQRRQALQAVEEPIPREPEPEEELAEELEEEADHEHEEPQSPQHRPSAPSRAPSAALLWLFLIGATVLLGVAVSVDDSVLAPKNLAEEKESAVTATAPDTGSPAGPRRNGNCRLVELSDTLIQVNCTGSSASMRWNGRWVLDSGHDERDALDFFNASDAARRVVAPLSREPVPRLPDQAEVEPERLPPSHKPVTPPAPPLQPEQAVPRPATMAPQPQPQPAAPRPAAAPQAQPQQRPQEPPQPRQHCSVSRPKPGFQVYLVTCPNSQATIGRTVDVTTGWTVSESVNGTEAIEFFLKSPYAR